MLPQPVPRPSPVAAANRWSGLGDCLRKNKKYEGATVAQLASSSWEPPSPPSDRSQDPSPPLSLQSEPSQESPPLAPMPDNSREPCKGVLPLTLVHPSPLP